jgi:hypothetical protein
VPVLASFASQFPPAVGAVAACMAIFGFIFQVVPALRRKGDTELRQKAALGGCVGLSIGFIVAVSSVTITI